MKLSVSLVPSALTNPILDGASAIEGVDVDARASKTVDGNSRAMLEGAFDVAEMSLATFVKARAEGAQLIGLPIFTGRRFLEPGIGIRKGAGITEPRELSGRRVGLPQFWMTSSVWHRAVLEELYFVPQTSVSWTALQPERFSGMAVPPGVSLSHRTDATFDELLRRGEIDAVLYPRPIADSFDPTYVYCPFRDIVATQRRFLAMNQFVPIMHFVVMREELCRSAPDLASRIQAAFDKAKKAVCAEPSRIPPRDLPLYGVEATTGFEILGADPWPFGLEPNRRALDWFLRHAHGQGLTRAAIAPESLFVAVE